MNTPNEESKKLIAEATENEAEVVRKLVVPNAPINSEDEDRSPTKTDRDLLSTVISEATSEADEVRKPLVPEE